MADRKIFIRPAPFGQGFDVTVEPPTPWANFNQERPTLRAARRYADSLCIGHGWNVVDQCEGSSTPASSGEGSSA